MATGHCGEIPDESYGAKKGTELMFSAFIAGVGVGVLVGLGIAALLAVAGKGGE